MRLPRTLSRGLGLALFILLLYWLDVGRALTSIREARWQLLLLAVALNLPQVSIKAARWRSLLRGQGLQVGLGWAISAYFVGIFAGALTPGRLGEFVRVFYLRRASAASHAQAFGSVLLDRLFDLLALLCVSMFALIVTQVEIELQLAVLAAWAFVCALFAGLVVLSETRAERLLQLAARLAGGYLPTGLGRWMREVVAGVVSLSPGLFLRSALLTAASYSVFFFQCFLIARSLDLPLSYPQVTAAAAVGTVAALLPLSLGGLGTRELALVAYLALLGVEAEPAFAFSLLMFATFPLAGSLMGLVAWLLRPLPLRLRPDQGGDRGSEELSS